MIVGRVLKSFICQFENNAFVNYFRTDHFRIDNYQFKNGAFFDSKMMMICLN